MINEYQNQPSICKYLREKVKIDFTGGILTSDAGVLFLLEIEKKMGVIKSLASVRFHIYEGRSGKLITTILRPGKRPNGREIRSILKRLVGYIREHWPEVKIFLRGDSHFNAPEMQGWCENNGVEYVLGQTVYAPIKEEAAGLLRQAAGLYESSGSKVWLPLFKDFFYQAGSWKIPARIICKAEVSSEGQNLRFVVTSLKSLRPSVIYDTIHCASGRMENFIKNHKNFLHSDRTSCHSFKTNQFRLFLHSAAYVLLHALAEKGLKGSRWAKAQFNTIQNRILKVGPRAKEMITRVRFCLPTSFPLKKLFKMILFNLAVVFP